MTPDEAKLVLIERFDLPLPLRFDRRRRLAPLPKALGATAHVDEALVERATRYREPRSLFRS